MTALLPPPLPHDAETLATLYRHPVADGRPYVRANMITSLDGAATAGATSGALGGAGDRRVFQALRQGADVVLVGAATVREEGYGTPQSPALAIVTRGDVERTERLYPAGGPEPIVYSGHGESVDLHEVLADLHRRGLHRVLAEGGPGVLGALLAADLVDELCLTIAPRVVGGHGGRIVAGPDLPADRWRPAHTLGDDEGYLYTRWLR
ncbi:Bifunctional deaminase-reductase domain protein OS=Tsukamurella paurometabola (strain ATCC 8368 /DSM / CCUG 35730 / CIP 100753 / JCM 10117 / KCTC 9821/ NBRC 16120 / NCIMB 702349 / NCTC 13040) OX=521096 GN=Tpau_1898 PE=4 SV=1 [Tsukamurella paurometabola]|uniref:Bifunctional deaminase-reductase domain protein n=1 Tax=Tsukamurella paurometabola (strain ATCC 8368 / DSM 20162 / CCUG 35730 / CIP 100753 / JCM 10117 / KCTC 9821 / NBRC 16120 / NCIMB 702349 / NCTC 13040) TaxID=521096 RepID=D5UN14_TSUPD|nr:dihydrofolate reductase family protein [Tsukamurella paurometabola]ADG78511.1 bifunctional deaminase-reductase domain protein [Tsukamurella paurometabola DSM 20162]SUP31986.1 Pyrimidine deaminase [Tsukamurella paurometabola]